MTMNTNKGKKVYMKGLLLFTLTLICTFSFGQVKLTNLKYADIPSNLKYEGKIINAVRWEDSLGLNYVITTETGKIYNKNKDRDDRFDAFLYAYHYIAKGENTKLIWKIYDYNKGCDLDLTFFFINDAFSVTDLDRNGVAEIWMMYKNSCHGDVSPVPTKLIMYEGLKKHALRGESKVKISENEYVGGTYTLDYNFKNCPAVFKEFAEKLWVKSKNETWHR